MEVVFLVVPLMNFFLGISKDIIEKVKVVLLEVSLIELHSSNIQRDQMECESGVTRSIIEEFHFSDIQGDQIEGERCVTRSIIDELHSWDIQGDQMGGERFVT